MRFILLTKLSPELNKRMKDRASIGEQWRIRVKKKCPEVEFIDHYALFGPYDFLDIYEAPDEKTAAKVSLISRAMGAEQAESWAAIPYQEFLEITDEI